VVLTSAAYQHTYEPTAEDFATGRTSCPDPDCRGWTWTATLTIPPPTVPDGFDAEAGQRPAVPGAVHLRVAGRPR